MDEQKFISSFEQLWSQLQDKVQRLEGGNKDIYAFRIQMEQWRLILLCVVGPRGGISDLIYLYDTSDPLREHRLRIPGLSANEWELSLNEKLLPLHKMRQEVQKAKASKLATAREVASREMEALYLRMKDSPSDYKKDFEEWAIFIGHSVVSFSGGAPDTGKHH